MIDLEKMIIDAPDYVSETTTKWFSQIPKGERDKPMLSVGDAVYSPNQILHELKQALKIELSDDERRNAVNRMSEVAKGIIGEVLQQYGGEGMQND